MESKTIYYYTDFNTFKLILQKGTLRFKESTSSNDNFDTIQLYESLAKMSGEKLNNEDLKSEQKFFFDMQKHNGSRSTRLSLVACFTSKADSRMLWDAYTMHRKDRTSRKYNGVCIGFNKARLIEAMNTGAKEFDIKRCHEIIYGFDRINDCLETYVDIFSKEVEEMSHDEDQSQNIIKPLIIPGINKEIILKKCLVYPMLKLVDRIDSTAPFFKHEFWSEEEETRALLSIKIGSETAKNINRYSSGGAYFDLPITLDCIDTVILGPEFSDEDLITVDSLEGIIPFKELHAVKSNGTGVITNR